MHLISVFVNWHISILLLLLLKHHKLLLLSLIKHINTTFLIGWRWDALREISQLIQLIEILCSLEQDFLVVIQKVVWIIVCILENVTIFL